MPIHVLSDDVAAKIAAGEVIERPASVVKELIENSIDAGAHDIRIEVRGGGQRLLRVADDGCGIPSSEVPLAFSHHATSKLTSADDLSAIRTLGFRGEALPSIAAVSRVTVITRAHGEDNGTLLKREGSKTIAHQTHGAPRGTVVTVEDLFQNLPARLKFLKAPGTEAARIMELVNAYALAYSAVRYSLVNDGRLLFQSTGNGKLFDVLIKVLGTETAREMIQLRGEQTGRLDDGDSIVPNEETIVSGFVSPPSIHRGTRKLQFLFVNGRWVEDRALAHAVIEAYHTMLMVGRFPIFVLDVHVPLDLVDVNVHPTKSQVRFREPGEVYRAVQRAVRRALTEAAPVPNIGAAGPIYSGQTFAQSSHGVNGMRPGAAPFSPPIRSDGSPAPIGPLGIPAIPNVKVPMLRVIGQVASTYIIAEGPDGLYLVDQHAAHERVLYEQLTAVKDTGYHSQELLEPLTIDLSPAQWSILNGKQALFEQVGFRLQAFGGQTIALRAVPSALKDRDPRAGFVQVVDELIEGETPLANDLESRLIMGICKSAAVKGGQTLSLEEMRALIRDLEKTTAPRTCPHGRPTMIQLNLQTLQREFGRRG